VYAKIKERDQKINQVFTKEVHKLKSTWEKENNHGREVNFRRKHSWNNRFIHLHETKDRGNKYKDRKRIKKIDSLMSGNFRMTLPSVHDNPPLQWREGNLNLKLLDGYCLLHLLPWVEEHLFHLWNLLHQKLQRLFAYTYNARPPKLEVPKLIIAAIKSRIDRESMI